ncbi:hypothetical protein [Pseudonocardia ailaonensis]|uniref:hypothetical protein n=1 Tax=Pseudonocardia ailaonensis TaxID=367279 RepID=UPI0031D8D98A
MSCAHAETLATELKALARTLVEGTGGAAACTSCPVCAVIALLRGERPEMLARLADQAGGVLAALRALLDELPHDEGTAPDDAQDDRRGPRVQRIPVVRA